MWEYVRDAAVTWFIGFFPMFEIYVAVPAGLAMGLGPGSAAFWSIFGNYTPVLLIEYGYSRVLRVERVRSWLESKRSERLERMINRYGPWFVLVITPWIGVWVVAATAKALGMERRGLLAYSFASILAYGLAIAYGAASLFDFEAWASNFSFDASRALLWLAVAAAIWVWRGARRRKRAQC